MNPYFVIVSSLSIQFFAAYLALRLIKITGKNIAWMVITAAFGVLAIRRCYTLFAWLSGSRIVPTDLTEEIVALTASALMAIGLAFIEPLFLSIKRSETKARQNEEKYRILVNNIPAVVFTGYQDGAIDFLDDKVEQLTGYPKEEFHSRRIKWTDLIDLEDLPAAREKFLEALTKDQSYVREYKIRPKGGPPVWIQERSRIIRNPEGGVDYISGVFFDVTEHHLMEEKLQESEKRFRAFMDHSPAAAFMKDQQGHYLYVNPVCERFADKKTDEWMGLTDYDLWPEDIARKHRQSDLEVLDSNYPLTSLIAIPSLAGNLTYWSVYKFPIMPQAQDHVLIGGVAVDITEQKQAEETKAQLEAQLAQAQKLESIGRLAGGIAHDFNNLLSAIMGFGEIMQLDLAPSDPRAPFIEEILKAAQRGAKLTKQLLAFSRKQILQPRILNLNEVVLDMENMLRRLIGEHIDLEVMLDSQLGYLEADPSQIEQVILNLVLNARDAMPGGGKLTIETANICLDESYAQQHLSVASGPYILLAVSDTGHGMDGETLNHIFEPFYTSKKKGEGTGMGLATVYGIVKQSGGDIWAYSEEGKGAAFKIYLPRVFTPVHVDERPGSNSRGLRGRETIMVVEDEESVRAIIAEALRRFGYHILEAGRGAEALALYQKHPHPIDLLVTDVVMPEMSGQVLAEKLAQINPHLKVLFTSGYSDNAIVRHGILLEGLHFIQKPFTIVAMLQKIREVLDSNK
ncbi:MAG: PAS domain S-box protein [Thermodesulfobacteriota bacterium]